MDTLPTAPASPLAEPAEIRIFEGLPFTDKNGDAWTIRATIDACDHCCDVYCDIDPVARVDPDAAFPELNGLAFCQDPSFLATVGARLTELGYPGPAPGRAEMGTQSADQVVLETPREFAEFAHKNYGWTYADGMDAWRLDGLRAAFSRSFDPRLVLAIEASDGSKWTVALHYVLMVFDQSFEEEFACRPETAEQVYSDPVLRGNVAALCEWVRDHRFFAYPRLKPYLHQAKAPDVDLVYQALGVGNFNISKD